MAREYINVNDFLNTGRKKLNKSIDKAYDADEKSDEAISTSNDAKETAENVQTQFNQVVIDGDSSVEAAQARVNAKGNAFPTLKARLDDENENVTRQLAHKVDGALEENGLLKLYAGNQLVAEIDGTAFANVGEVRSYIDSLIDEEVIQGASIEPGSQTTELFENETKEKFNAILNAMTKVGE